MAPWRFSGTQKFGELPLPLPHERRVRMRYAKPSRSKPARTVLHIPPLPGLRRVVVNGTDIGKITGSVTLWEF
jgi:hypothetical protein